MAQAPFDLSGALTFDLSSGRVNLEHAPAMILAPAESLAALCEAAGEDATRAFGSAMGASMGHRIAKRVAQAPAQDAIGDVAADMFVGQLRSEFAIAGLGVIGIERWGRALLIVVDHTVAPTTLVAAVLDTVFETTTGRKTSCLALMRSGSRSRWLVAGRAAAERVAAWLADGASWGEVLVKLHVGGEAPQTRGDA
jgi:hypothetical protein